MRMSLAGKDDMAFRSSGHPWSHLKKGHSDSDLYSGSTDTGPSCLASTNGTGSGTTSIYPHGREDASLELRASGSMNLPFE